MNILITGGAGYIGSHTIVEMLNKNHSVIVFDNLSNSSENVIKRIEKITNKHISFYKVDIRDKKAISEILNNKHIDCCVHFAGLKSVGESVYNPLEYYNNNVNGTLVLLEVLKNNGCKNIIFSSSATVYGIPKNVPISENEIKGVCTNPYGWTKWIIEQIFEDLYNSDNTWNIVMLRYFNPIGAHHSGLLGESPNGIPNNLVPYITQVAIGKLEKLHVFGNDYDTHDGTGIRDYIHVVDLAKGHVAALNAIKNNCGIKTYNLGTGKGYSVLDIIHTFEEIIGKKIPYEFCPRRKGDVAVCYSDPSKAFKELKWKTEYSLKEMCRDSWNFQLMESRKNEIDK